MRDNLIFRGIPDVADIKQPENTEEKLKTFLTNELGIEDNIPFHVVHRLKPRHERGPRGIVAKYEKRKDREKIVNLCSGSRKLIINQKTDCLLGCLYIPPANSKYSTSESFDEVENEMLNIKNIDSLNCIIFGDFNAKTGSLLDYIIPDENLVDIFEFNADEDILSYMFDYENLPRNSIPLHRVTSCNCAPNNYGHKLLHVCKRNNMYIANSRVGNDRVVIEFDIKQFDQLVSDVHCQLHLVIQAPLILYNSNDELSQLDSEKYVKWREGKCSEFLDNVKSDHYCHLEQILLELDSLEVQQGIHQNEMNKVVERISNFFSISCYENFW
ncbi:unnamed protein product [Mytilus coruscus]|uniref:Endonuclease/exonuclease/phosphatase domain-containing protein n=1 Tax=Mytilus coruscus TaxID=42192 RepID=A0A6J8E134_MYTCO|nr:unnamed protein product [Mytilus coruscus]